MDETPKNKKVFSKIRDKSPELASKPNLTNMNVNLSYKKMKNPLKKKGIKLNRYLKEPLNESFLPFQ